MHIPECNHKVTGSGYKAVDGYEAVNRRLWSRSRLWSRNQHKSTGNVQQSALTFWSALSQLLASRFLEIFRVISAKPHHHDKVADHGGVKHYQLKYKIGW